MTSYLSVLSNYKKLKSSMKYKLDTSKYIRSFDFENPPLFQYIEIETINRCNGHCSFCPVNVTEPQRKFAKMNEELFIRIIKELARLKFAGRLALFSNNEPFLDNRIIDFAKITRENLPDCYIELYTNGSLLNEKNITDIAPYISGMVIDNYSDAGEFTYNLERLEIFCRKHQELREKIVFAMRKENEVLTSRGGEAPNIRARGGVKVPRAACFYPFKQIVIRPDGKCSLCCNDALGKYTLGDLNTQSLLDIWRSKKYDKIRQEMKNHGRRNLKLCNRCDTQNFV